MFDTCNEHLREIHDFQNGPDESQIHLISVRRLSANIVASTSANFLDRNQGAVENNDDDEDDDSTDDCIITGVSGTVFLPFRSTTNDLIKQENDRISGDVPYMDTVSSISSFFSKDSHLFNFLS